METILCLFRELATGGPAFSTGARGVLHTLEDALDTSQALLNVSNRLAGLRACRSLQCSDRQTQLHKPPVRRLPSELPGARPL